MNICKPRIARPGHAALRTALLAFFMLAWFAGARAGGKQIPLTTSSQQAKELFGQAVQAVESFDNQKATQLAQQAVAADSNFAFGQMLVATLTPSARRQPLVDKFLALAKKASPGEQRYLEAMALALGSDAEKSLSLFEKLHKDFPEDRRVCMMLGQVNMNAGKFDQAMPYLERAIKLEGSTARAYSFLGNCYLFKDQYAKAREFYQTALSKVGAEASPNQPFFGVTYSYLYEGQPEPALANDREFLRRYESNGSAKNLPPVWIYNNMARINLEFGRLDEAMKLYETGYQSVPGSSLDSTQKKIWYGRMFHGKARTLAKMGKYDEAWQMAEQIKQMIETGGKAGEDFWPSYHYLAGYILLEKGDYKAAAEHMEQAHEYDPFHKLLLARASLKQGNKAYALQKYQEIVKTNSSNMERALAYPEAKKMVAELSGTN